MRTGHRHWIYVLAVMAGLLAPPALTAAMAEASGDTTLSYATLEPAHIELGGSAVIRITTFYGRLSSVPPLPSVPGLTFQVLGREQGFEFGNGQTIPATYILIKVTPHSAGLFSIPGLLPKSKALLLDVLDPNQPDPYAYRSGPQPLPVKPAPVPKGLQLKEGGAAFVQLILPKHTLYVGESVPVDIEVGVRPGIVTSINGLPTLSSGDFTLNNLSRQPIRREQDIQGNPFVVMTWHTVLAAVKPGDFSLAVRTPLSVRKVSSEDPFYLRDWPFTQPVPKGPPRDVTVPSPPEKLTVLPLPTQGQPPDFSGAVGDFQVSSDISPATAAAGEPQTLRLHVSGAGNFDRVSSTMLQHLDHWKTYPVKSSFTPRNAVGYSGEKVFEQPLIASLAGAQVIPPLELSYFNPTIRRYERARTRPITVMITGSPGEAGNSAASGQLAQGLRPDHPRPQAEGSDLEPLYFKASFLALPATLVVIFAGCWLAVRPDPVRVTARAAEQALAELNAAVRTGDSASFFEVGRRRLLEAFAARWRVPADQVTAAQLKLRLGPAGEDIGRFLALAEEVKYADSKPGSADCQRWLVLISSQLTGGST